VARKVPLQDLGLCRSRLSSTGDCHKAPKHDWRLQKFHHQQLRNQQGSDEDPNLIWPTMPSRESAGSAHTAVPRPNYKYCVNF